MIKQARSIAFPPAEKVTTRWCLVDIILLAAVLRLYHLDYQSLWVDEITSLEDAAPHDFQHFWRTDQSHAADAASDSVWGVIEESQWAPYPRWRIDPDRRVVQYLEARHALVASRAFGNTVVTLYDARGGGQGVS